MAEAFVQLPADGVGKKVRSFENTIAGNVVESQALTLVDAAGNIIASLASAPVGSEQAVAVRPIESDVTASGTITATDAVVAAPDGSGQLITGASTAGSLVAMALPGGDASWVAQITGLTSGSLFFEGSIDSTNGTDGHWASVEMQRVGIPDRGSNVTRGNGIFRGDASALSFVRVRSAGALSGTPAVSLRVSDATPAIMVDGSRTTLTGPLGDEIDTYAGALSTRLADVDAVQGDPGQRARLTAGGRKEVPFTLAGSQALVLDVSAYAAISIQVQSLGSGATFSASNDNATWVQCPLASDGSSITTPPTSSPANPGIYSGPLRSRYFRVLAGGSSACVGVIELFSGPKSPAAIGVLNAAASIGLLGAFFSQADAQTASFTGTFPPEYVYNGATWDRLRTPAKFFTATATASGDTAVWTPAVGKKFRLMRYSIEVTANAATAGGSVLEVVLRDGTAAMGMGFSTNVPTVAGTTFGNDSGSGWRDIGNGFLAAAANDVLNVNLSATLTSGEVRVNVCGTEE